METPNETTWPAVSAERAPAEPAQPVAPSESAGVQTAAGSPSEQPEVAVAAPAETPVDPQTAPTDGAETVQPAATEDPLLSPVDIAPSEAPAVEPEPGGQVGPPLSAEGSVETLPPESPAAQPGLKARPAGVGVDGAVYRGRDDNDAVTDRFCRVVSGSYAGRYGVYLSTASLGADGWPETIVVRTRDAEDENLVVNYSDCRPSVPGKR